MINALQESFFILVCTLKVYNKYIAVPLETYNILKSWHNKYIPIMQSSTMLVKNLYDDDLEYPDIALSAHYNDYIYGRIWWTQLSDIHDSKEIPIVLESLLNDVKPLLPQSEAYEQTGYSLSLDHAWYELVLRENKRYQSEAIRKLGSYKEIYYQYQINNLISNKNTTYRLNDLYDTIFN